MTRPFRSHGASGYAAGCRCPACSDASYFRRQELLERRRERIAAGELLVPHGTNNGYVNYECRCDPCKDAAAEYQRNYRLSWRPDRATRGSPGGGTDRGCTTVDRQTDHG